MSISSALWAQGHSERAEEDFDEAAMLLEMATRWVEGPHLTNPRQQEKESDMFISVVRTPCDGTAQRHTSLYECERFHILPVDGTPTEFCITMEGRADTREAVAVTYDTKEPCLGIYVMNDRGQTIDTIFRSPE